MNARLLHAYLSFLLSVAHSAESKLGAARGPVETPDDGEYGGERRRMLARSEKYSERLDGLAADDGPPDTILWRNADTFKPSPVNRVFWTKLCEAPSEFPACKPTCLKNDGVDGSCPPGSTACRQVIGRVYRVAGACYKAANDCRGCLEGQLASLGGSPKYPKDLPPVSCPMKTQSSLFKHVCANQPPVFQVRFAAALCAEERKVLEAKPPIETASECADVAAADAECSNVFDFVAKPKPACACVKKDKICKAVDNDKGGNVYVING